MKVMFATPAYDGSCHAFMVRSLIEEMAILRDSGIASVWNPYTGCCYLPIARNMLVKDFLKSDCTDLFFIDADTEWEPGAAKKLLEYDKDIIVGMYPHKTGLGTFPGAVATNDAGDATFDGDLVEVAIAPTGFMRIKREVFDVLDQYCENLDVVDPREPDSTYKCYFDTMKIRENWWGEDTHFCNIWRSIDGRIWAYPDIEFTHHGFYGFKGNFSSVIKEKYV